MIEEDVEAVRDFFYGYANGFIAKHEDNQPFILKRDHTFRVFANIGILAKSLELSAEKTRMARVAALVHDLGRFRQYDTWNSFSDQPGRDHACIGVEEIQAHGVLDRLSETEQALIIRAVQYHNTRFLPPDLNGFGLILTRLLRDADKIDIYRVMAGKYRQDRSGKGKNNEYITLSRTDNGLVSQKLVNEIRQAKMLDLEQVQSLNDLKLLQVSWIFDLNFEKTLGIIMEKHYMDIILDSMPQTETINSLRQFIHEVMAKIVAGRPVREEGL